VIEEVGPIPGFFLAHPHTREWWQKEQYLPKVADRLSYPDWLGSGKKSALDLARERAAEIVATHEPTPPLPPGKEEELDRILEEAKAYYKNKGLL
jgi:trimethylamine--corrinoid protein Co-methyltransferase